MTLRVVADLPAGSSDDPSFGAGEAVRIMTGAPVPTDADAIVPFEDTAGGLADSLGTVEVRRAPAASGAFIRRRGGDTRAARSSCRPGSAWDRSRWPRPPRRASPSSRYTAARGSPSCRPAASWSSPGVVPGRGQTPDSNSTLLAVLVAETGAEVTVTSSLQDDANAIHALLDHAADVDVIVFSGGVSAGAYEPVRQALEGRIAFEKVAMQPGKPQAFGALDDGRLVFGLPGNPVSVAVSFEVFVRPALLALQGRTVIDRRIARLTASETWTTPPGRRQYLPAAIDLVAGTVRPATAGGSGSHLAASLARAEAFAIVPAEVSTVSVGDPLDVMLIP